MPQKVLLVPSADFYHLPDKDHMILLLCMAVLGVSES